MSSEGDSGSRPPAEGDSGMKPPARVEKLAKDLLHVLEGACSATGSRNLTSPDKSGLEAHSVVSSRDSSYRATKSSFDSDSGAFAPVQSVPVDISDLAMQTKSLLYAFSSAEREFLANSSYQSTNSSIGKSSGTLTPLQFEPDDNLEPAVRTLPQLPIQEDLSIEKKIQSTVADLPPLQSNLSADIVRAAPEVSTDSTKHCDNVISNNEVPAADEVSAADGADENSFTHIEQVLINASEQRKTGFCERFQFFASEVRVCFQPILSFFILLLSVLTVCMGRKFRNQCHFNTTPVIMMGLCGLLGLVLRVLSDVFAQFFYPGYILFQTLMQIIALMGALAMALEVSELLRVEDYGTCSVFFNYIYHMNIIVVVLAILIVLIHLDVLYAKLLSCIQSS
ncbi:hypothetical protein NPIL_32641 [Nephila pilipes]|uniref:Uncharacterized protein n=1 Tax=Nephila pilipes TaxID=299642 RepID=A0A8X6R388_NEPPI|nr:hypothetical protein NPIL_32641 [Nephila pilipes]